MHKNDLVELMAEGAGISKASAMRALDTMMEGVTEALKGGEKVTLTGFGTFSTSVREARTGRNPQTGKKIKIPAKSVVKFKAGTKLTEALN